MRTRITRERIVRVTKEMITRNGIRGVRIEEIVQQLGISKRTLYEMFSDKEELVGECWKCILEESLAAVERLLGNVEAPSVERAVGVIDEFVSNIYYVDVAALAELQRTHFAAISRSNHEFWCESFRRMFEQCSADGYLPAGLECRILAERFLSMLFNLRMQNPPADEVRRFGRILLRGIATAKGIEYLDR